MQIPQVVRTYIETFTRDGLDTWIATFAPDGTYSDPNIPNPVPAHGLKEHFVGFFSGFPDGTCELVGIDAISERLGFGVGYFMGPILAPSEASLRRGAA
jgi:SnoaL-like domain